MDKLSKLKEIIKEIVREEIMGEAYAGPSAVDDIQKDPKFNKVVNKTDTINILKKGGSVDLGETEQPVSEMARASEVFYSLKPDFKDDLQNVQNKLSKSEFRSLVDIVKVLKDAGVALTANDILRKHNEANPDRQYSSQQAFIRPLVIGAIGKKKINYDDLPFKASQKDVSTSYEKATQTITPSQTRGDKFGRDVEYEPATLANPDYKLPADRASLAASMLDYKRAREAYRKADNPISKQKYLDKLQSLADNPVIGKEIAQQYSDGYIATQDPVTLATFKKYKDSIGKAKYKTPKFSSQNIDVTQDNPDETEED